MSEGNQNSLLQFLGEPVEEDVTSKYDFVDEESDDLDLVGSDLLKEAFDENLDDKNGTGSNSSKGMIRNATRATEDDDIMNDFEEELFGETFPEDTYDSSISTSSLEGED